MKNTLLLENPLQSVEQSVLQLGEELRESIIEVSNATAKKINKKTAKAKHYFQRKPTFINVDIFAQRLATWGENDDLFDFRL